MKAFPHQCSDSLCFTHLIINLLFPCLCINTCYWYKYHKVHWNFKTLFKQGILQSNPQTRLHQCMGVYQISLSSCMVQGKASNLGESGDTSGRVSTKCFRRLLFQEGHICSTEQTAKPLGSHHPLQEQICLSCFAPSWLFFVFCFEFKTLQSY